MPRTFIDMGEYSISGHDDSALIIPSLGSCLGVCIVSHASSLCGMAHMVLPLSSQHQLRNDRPCAYVDTGMHLFISMLIDKGLDTRAASIYVAGGAAMWDDQGVFDIGKRNYLIFRRFLWKNKLLITGEDVGGSVSRNMKYDSRKRELSISSNGQLRFFKTVPDERENADGA